MTTTVNNSGCPVDSDGDGYPDCVDECPNDPSLHTKSTCGCQPQSACNCSQSTCPPAVYQSGGSTPDSGSNSTSPANVTVALVPNSTNTQVTLTSSKRTLDVSLGWGLISEISSAGKRIKTVDPNNGNWTRTITANDTMIIAEYRSDELAGFDSSVRIVLLTQITFASSSVNESSAQQKLQKHTKAATNTTEQQGSFIKFSVHITGDWGFQNAKNKLKVDFTVDAAVRKRKTCDTTQSWELASNTESAKTFRVFLANDTATTLGFLKDCTADGTQRVVSISDPDFKEDMSGWTTTVVFPSFVEDLYYDPSFALLLGYTDSNCDPLLSWILPVAFIGAAAVCIVLIVALLYYPPTARFLIGRRAFQIQSVRGEIKRDYKMESQSQSIAESALPVREASQPKELKIITNEEELEELS